MADTAVANTPPNPVVEAEKVKTHNASVAAQLENQGRQYDDPSALDDTGSALDDLARETGSTEPTEEEKAAAAAAEAEAKAKEEKEAADAAAAAAATAAEGQTEEEKAAAAAAKAKEDDDAAAAAAAAAGEGTPVVEKKDDDTKPGEDVFDGVKLPDTVTTTSAQAFDKVKTTAREEIAKRNAEIAALTTKVNELEGKVKTALPEEAKAEFESLRQFRAKIDVETDPEFKKHDERVASASEFVYAQMKRAGIDDTTIEDIKKLGGPHKVKLEKIFDVMGDPQAERLINSKVADIEEEVFNKDQSIAKAKENIGEYLKQKQDQLTSGITQHREVTKAQLDDILPKLEFMKPVTVKAGATEDEKKLADAQNTFINSANEQIGYALSDDSPQMRAILIAGLAKLMHHEVTIKGQGAVIKNKDAQIAALTKERDDAKALADKLASGSVSRRGQSNAGGSRTVVSTPEFDPNETAEDALDRVAKQIQEKQRSNAVS